MRVCHLGDDFLLDFLLLSELPPVSLPPPPPLLENLCERVAAPERGGATGPKATPSDCKLDIDIEEEESALLLEEELDLLPPLEEEEEEVLALAGGDLEWWCERLELDLEELGLWWW